MPDPPSYDQTLLDRLNALKKSYVQLNSQTPIAPIPREESTPETDLSARLRSLRNGSLSPAGSPAAKNAAPKTFNAAPVTLPQSEAPDPLRNPTTDLDDQTLEELLAELTPDDKWNLKPDEPYDIQRLLNEAKRALPQDEVSPNVRYDGQRMSADSQGALTRDLDMSVFTSMVDKDEEDEPEKGEAAHAGSKDSSREVDDIIQRAMDDASLEKGQHGADNSELVRRDGKSGTEDSANGISLPSSPSALPEPTTTDTTRDRKSVDFENDIASRMTALSSLGLPSTPTTIKDYLDLPSAPTSKPGAVVPKDLFPPEEIDSWCIICQDDATVKCMGCDGDLYCANCWKEGHMGPDVGYEEKTHKWTKYRKPN
ncbi:hypothetical protein BJ875DRAFT_165467 [Amylocarpus encephaloides]|uniref:Abscission/NoCut checkpoint regulator n=1 Tax=Amylocarpus encephaloides TaxID=45428 RepID=A0A9P7YAI2_9HELO|nr:hypothetical protein BJ875DRAFT_165467 [Amylocarpus encephaloides]